MISDVHGTITDAPIDLSAYSCLGRMALTGDHLWIPYGCGSTTATSPGSSRM